jgi:hypothetical protein
MATAQATTDHDEIRTWVEARGGHPARVRSTGSRQDPGILRIDFPGFSGEDTLEEIGWDDFFEWFDRDNLALLLSDEEGNRFNKLVSRGNAASSVSRKRASSAKKSPSRRVAQSSSGKKAASAKKASASTKKAASSTKASASKSTSRPVSKSSSTKKASSSTKKAASSKKASSSTKKASSKKAPAARKGSAKKASSSTRRLVGSTTAKKTSAKKASAKKASTKKASTKNAAGNTTTDHDEIRRWVEARGGFPAHVRQTGRKRGDLGVLRIDYPGYSGKDTLERVDWEDWFAAFDRNKLAFLHDTKRDSRFSKLVNR